jgi:hypothetical protein
MIRMNDLAGGLVVVYGMQGGYGEGELVAGETCTIDVRIEGGRTVRGRVIDALFLDRPALDLGTFEVGHEQRLDLGSLEVHPPGQLEVAFADSVVIEGDPWAHVSVHGVSMDGRADSSCLASLSMKELVSPLELWPGSYELRYRGYALAQAPVRFGVVPNEATRIELDPQRAPMCAIEVTLPLGSPGGPERFVEIVDGKDRITASCLVEERNGSAGFICRRALLPGTYRICVTTNGVPGGEQDLFVPAGSQASESDPLLYHLDFP